MPSWVTHSDDPIAFEHQIVDRLLEQRQIGLVFQAGPDRLPVKDAVGLSAGRAYRRSLARVQDAELDPGLVGGECHRAAEGVDLLDQVSLADAPDRGIARHLAQSLDAMR